MLELLVGTIERKPKVVGVPLFYKRFTGSLVKLGLRACIELSLMLLQVWRTSLTQKSDKYMIGDT